MRNVALLACLLIAIASARPQSRITKLKQQIMDADRFEELDMGLYASSGAAGDDDASTGGAAGDDDASTGAAGEEKETQWAELRTAAVDNSPPTPAPLKDPVKVKVDMMGLDKVKMPEDVYAEVPDTNVVISCQQNFTNCTRIVQDNKEDGHDKEGTPGIYPHQHGYYGDPDSPFPADTMDWKRPVFTGPRNEGEDVITGNFAPGVNGDADYTAPEVKKLAAE